MSKQEQQSNKIGVNQGKKVRLDGYVFDSQQEASFYQQFVKGKCWELHVHNPIRIIEPYQLGGTDCKGFDYKPDFTVVDQPVEVVIPRKGWFWLKIIGTKKKFEPVKMRSLDYDIHEFIGQ